MEAIANKTLTFVSFGHLLCGLASTFDNFRWLWSNSNSRASRRKSFTVWPPNTSWHKLIARHLYMRNWWVCVTCVNVRADLRICLAIHHKSVRKFWFCKLALTCADFESVWWGANTERRFFYAHDISKSDSVISNLMLLRNPHINCRFSWWMWTRDFRCESRFFPPFRNLLKLLLSK